MAGRRDIQAGKAYVSMYVRNKGLIGGLRKASARLKSFGAGMQSIGVKMMAAGGAMVAPFLLAVKSFASAGDELDKMSGRIGVSVEFLSKLGHAAGLGGSNIKAMENGIRRMQRTAMDASRGLSTAVDVFDELGISAKDSGGNLKGTEALFMESVDALSKVENETKKAALAQMLFGKSGTAMLPMLKDGKKGMMAAMEEAKKLGIVMSTEDATSAAVLTDAFAKLSSVWKMIKMQIGGALAPMLSDLFDTITQNSKAVIDWVKDNKELIVSVFKIAVGVAAAGAAIAVIGTAIVGVGVVVGSAAAIVSGLGVAFSMAATVLGAILSPIGLVITAVVGLVGYFAWASGSITGVLDWLRNGFGVLKTDALAAFGGISDAMSAGDMKLAAKILWAFLKLQWQTGLSYLKGLWDGFKSFWDDGVQGLGLMFIDGVANVKTAWVDMIGFIKKKWLEFSNSSFTEGIADLIAPIIAVIEGVSVADVRKNLKEDFKNERSKQTENTEGIDAETAAKKAKIESDAEASKAQIGEDIRRRKEKETAAGSTAQAELDAARKELADLTVKAKDKSKQKKLGDDPSKPGKAPGMSGLPSAAAIGGTAVGTFSAGQASLMGGGQSVAERTYQNAVKQFRTLAEIKEYNRKMYDEAKQARRTRATA